MSMASAVPQRVRERRDARHVTPDDQPIRQQSGSPFVQSSPIVAHIPITSFDPATDVVLKTLANLEKRFIILKGEVNQPIEWYEHVDIEIDIKDRPWDFEKGDTDKQIFMRHAFLFDGRSKGLASTIEQFSLNDSMMPQRYVSSTIWRHVRAPAGNPVRMMRIIDCIHHDLVVAMIDGNPAYRMCHDIKFASDMKAFHDSQTKMPGQYLMQFARGPKGVSDEDCPSTRSTQALRVHDDPEGGCYLSPNELRKLIECAERYLNPIEWSYAREVDNVWNDNKTEHPDSHYKGQWFGVKPGSRVGTAQTKNDPYRRFYDAKNSLKATEWIDFMKTNFEARMHLLSDDERKRILHWSPLEIGYSIDIYKRVDEHSNYNQSNRLFVFQNSLITHTFDPTKTIFKTYKFAINRLCNPQDAFQEACTSDVGVTMIAKSHWFDGGLNPDPGAGGGVNEAILQLPNVQANLRESWNYYHADNSLLHTNIRKDEQHLEFLEDHANTFRNPLRAEKAVETTRKILLHRMADIEDSLNTLRTAVRTRDIMDKVATLKQRRDLLERASTPGSDD